MDSIDENDVFNSSADLFDDAEEVHGTPNSADPKEAETIFSTDKKTSAAIHDVIRCTQTKDSLSFSDTDTPPKFHSSPGSSFAQLEENTSLGFLQDGCNGEHSHSYSYHEIDETSEEESFVGLPSKKHKVCHSEDEDIDGSNLVTIAEDTISHIQESHVFGSNLITVTEDTINNIQVLNVSGNSAHNVNTDLSDHSADNNRHTDTSACRCISPTELGRPSQNLPLSDNVSEVTNELCCDTGLVVQAASNTIDNHDGNSLNCSSFDKNTIDSHVTANTNQGIDVASLSQNLPHLLTDVGHLYCPFCNLLLDNLYQINSHIEIFHSDTSNGDNEQAVVQTQTFEFVCPFCDLDLGDLTALDVHVLAAHAEEQDEQTSAACPLCGVNFHSEDSLRVHIKTHEADETIYGISETDQETCFPALPSGSVMSCPVCSLEMADGDLLTSHVESHFNPHHRPRMGSDSESGAKQEIKENILVERSVKQGLAQQEVIKENIPVERSVKQRLAENHKEKPKMNGQDVPSTSRGNGKTSNGKENISYKQQYVQNLERAVAGGKMTVSDYHEQRLLMAETELLGVDNGSTRTQGLIEKLESLYRNQARAGQVAHLCSAVDHFAGSYGDKGWGCGYRNFQMMLSCLSRHPDYARRIFTDENVSIPSIPKIQQMIELAWKKGFDPPGCQQLGGSLVNTRKWIGATEIVATLSSLGIKCQLVDFCVPSASDGTHPRLLEWVSNYFCRHQRGFLPPLYLQHQGHSRMIVGVEIERGTTRLLLFDPGSSSDQMASLVKQQLSWKHMRIFRRTQSGFKAKQYQIVAVIGLLTDAEYQESKRLRSEQIS